MKNVKYILGFMGFLVAAFLVYDVVKNKENPCGQLFEQTTASLTTKIKLLKQNTALTVGRSRVQALSSSAQQVALSLQSCCIAAQTSLISSKQFLQCQTGVTTYASRLDEITARLAELEKKTEEPIVVASRSMKSNDAAVRSLESGDVAPNALNRRTMQPTDTSSAKKPTIVKSKTDMYLDGLIDKALSASTDYRQNVSKIISK